ncbi:uncharacterized protein LOC126372153 isoform X1 [Pectinophora gossypiella]|nr:uncharacterized protein LOC126372153 isoform X1 [Pectinophora gossypiella]
MNEHSRSTRLRTVFDGSLKGSKGVSLNDLLLNGPVVQRDLFDIILLYRFGAYTITADIRHMFRNIRINPQYTSLQNVLWRDNPNEDIKCIQLDTVTYGLKSSSYLATRCLKELSTRFNNELPLASFILDNCCYVDDILYSNDDLSTLVTAKNELREMLARGGFQTHKWTSNNPDVLSDILPEQRHLNELPSPENQSFKALGLNVDLSDDSFIISSPEPYDFKRVTKRNILSYVCKFFDPMGYASPIIVRAKVILQKIWSANVGWDSPLPENIKNEWLQFIESLNKLEPIYLSRNIPVKQAGKVELIGFADASSKVAYGCCTYLRVTSSTGEVLLSLLCSKSRINPLSKSLTVPRLELNACLLLAKLVKKVYETIQLKIPIHNVYLFSDSKIVLAWMKTEVAKLGAYVANRIKVVCDLTSNFHWLYVNTIDNPADLVSRGINPSDLPHSKLWWHGPDFLRNSEYSFNEHMDLPVNLPELKSATPESPANLPEARPPAP